MADQTDEYGYAIPTQEEMEAAAKLKEEERLAEEAKTRQALALTTGMESVVSPLPTTLPTQTMPVDAPSAPMIDRIPPGAAPLQMPVSGGRMYMGPSSGPALDEFTAGRGPASVNLIPPPSGPTPSRLEQLQAADISPSRTISIRDESPYSDASISSNQNAMRFNAMKAFDAGDRSPEVIAVAMGSGIPKGMTQYQQNTVAHRKFLEEQAAKKLPTPRRDMVLESAIRDERASYNKIRSDLSKNPPLDGTDPRFNEASLHQKKLASLMDQYQKTLPSTATGITPPVQPATSVPAGPIKEPAFKSEAEARKSGFKGIAIINGRRAKIE